MKRLIFVRHGRAEEGGSTIPDFERSLTTKGKSVSEEMALKLRQKDIMPAVFITSPAFRAYETAVIFARVLDYDPGKIILNNDLYSHPTLKTISELTEGISSGIDTTIFFGHNPSFTEIPDRLSKHGCDFLPKSAVVCLSFKTDKWKGIVREKGTIEYFLKPEKNI